MRTNVCAIDARLQLTDSKLQDAVNKQQQFRMHHGTLLGKRTRVECFI